MSLLQKKPDVAPFLAGGIANSLAKSMSRLTPCQIHGKARTSFKSLDKKLAKILRYEEMSGEGPFG